MAVQTSGMICEIDDFEILKISDKLENESPVAKYLNVNASLSLEGIAFRNLVSSFRILGSTNVSNWLNVSYDILQQFLKLSPPSFCKSFSNIVPLYTPLLLYNEVIHQRRFLLVFDFFFFINDFISKKLEAANNKSSFSLDDILKLINFRIQHRKISLSLKFLKKNQQSPYSTVVLSILTKYCVFRYLGTKIFVGAKTDEHERSSNVNDRGRMSTEYAFAFVR